MAGNDPEFESKAADHTRRIFDYRLTKIHLPAAKSERSEPQGGLNGWCAVLADMQRFVYFSRHPQLVQHYRTTPKYLPFSPLVLPCGAT